MAPGSQEGDFSSGEEAETPVQASQNVSQPSVPVSLPPEIGRSPTNSSKSPETEDTPSLKDLTHSVYTILRCKQGTFSVSKIKKTYLYFRGFMCHRTPIPQSNHISTSLQIINDEIVANESHFSKVIGFGLLMSITVLKIISLILIWVSWYPPLRRLYRLLLIPDHFMDCVFLGLFGPKSENLLRNASHVLGTAEHFLSAVAPLPKASSLPAEVKPFLLQVDKALCAS